MHFHDQDNIFGTTEILIYKLTTDSKAQLEQVTYQNDFGYLAS